ncbi:oxidoreductase [Exophiala aquamarina CBS 119918]|uniref:Oxidoreductase n=1 Tax=Exophiala aquamarina CBS 119918 TaxID=1182545 RepID=A0A072P9E3_9EURO|nr:oxidoreductase [Exophiala aquamarina CBS 119918]KEF56491.1 oxidoreductase [Exophiala aquamarina CBS 119918]
MSTQGLSGKTCLVTGGGGGLGKEISRQLLAKGANVVICDINKDLLDSASKEFSGQGTLLTIQCDITSSESAEAMFEEIIQKLGKLDVLVNNAGIMDRFDPAGDLEKDLWDKVIAVNLTAPYLLTRLAVRHFLERGATDASILNVGSLSSQGGFFAGAAYTASKHGLLGLSKNTAAFYRDKGIRCNLIIPSGMQTNIVTAFAQGTNQDGMALAMTCGQAVKAAVVPLEDVARLAVFLSSDESSAISGSCVTLDKGFTSLF